MRGRRPPKRRCPSCGGDFYGWSEKQGCPGCHRAQRDDNAGAGRTIREIARARQEQINREAAEGSL